jgi:hypothetical protein
MTALENLLAGAGCAPTSPLRGGRTRGGAPSRVGAAGDGRCAWGLGGVPHRAGRRPAPRTPTPAPPRKGEGGASPNATRLPVRDPGEAAR